MKEEIDILGKARKYCDYTERCIQDVKDKLKQWETPEQLVEGFIDVLVEENLLNEERYVRAFVNGKLNYNKWGKQKIGFALRQKKIDQQLINRVLNEIDGKLYCETLRSLLSSKSVKEENPFVLKGKLAQYAIQKGYESSLVWQILNE